MPESNLEARIAALDSQVQTILRELSGLERLFPSIRESASVEQQVAVLEAEVEFIKSKLDKKIERHEFWPVRALAYGLAAMILTGVAAAMLKLVVTPMGIK